MFLILLQYVEQLLRNRQNLEFYIGKCDWPCLAGAIDFQCWLAAQLQIAYYDWLGNLSVCGRYVVGKCGWNVVGKGGRYVVGTWSVKAVGMWSVHGRYMVGKGGWYVVGKEREVVGKSSRVVGMGSVAILFQFTFIAALNVTLTFINLLFIFFFHLTSRGWTIADWQSTEAQVRPAVFGSELRHGRYCTVEQRAAWEKSVVRRLFHSSLRASIVVFIRVFCSRNSLA